MLLIDVAVIFVIPALLIVIAANSALPAGIVTLYPFNNKVRGTATFTSELPVI